MLQWFSRLNAIIIFNLLKFCSCWIAVWNPDDSTCHRIISVYWDEEREKVLICCHGDTRHFCLRIDGRRIRGGDHFHIQRGEGVESRVLQCHVTIQNESTMSVCSQWEVYAQRTEVQNKQPKPKIISHDSIHTHLQTLPLLCTHACSYTHRFPLSDFPDIHHVERPFCFLFYFIPCVSASV